MQIYRIILRNYCANIPRYTVACSFLGIPVLIVSLLVALNGQEDFITKRACWCRGGSVVFWTFVGIISLILMVSLYFKLFCAVNKMQKYTRAIICSY